MATSISNDLLKERINAVILKSLTSGDREGTEIIKEIEQKTSGQFRLKTPTLLSCLRKLEEQGFVNAYMDEGKIGKRTKERKMYALTQSGRDNFIKSMAEWEYQRSIADQLISDRVFNLSLLPPVVSAPPKPKKPKPFRDTQVPEFKQFAQPTFAMPTQQSTAHEPTQDFVEFEHIDGDQHVVMQEPNEQSNPEQFMPFGDFAEGQIIAASTVQPPTLDEQDTVYTRQQFDASAVAQPLIQNSSEDIYLDSLQNTQYAPTIDNDIDNTPPLSPLNLDREQDNTETTMTNTTTFTTDYATAYTPPQPKKVTINSTDENRLILEREYRKFLAELIVEQPFATAQYADNNSRQYTTTVNTDRMSQTQAVASDTVQYNAQDTMSHTQSFGSTGATTQIQDWQTEYEYPVAQSVQDMSDNTAINFGIDQYPDRTAFYTHSTTTQSSTKIGVNSQIQKDSYTKLSGNIKLLGNGLSVRPHNQAQIKQYTNNHYYYSNRLMVNHFAILFMIMIIEIAATFALLNLVIGVNQAVSSVVLSYAIALGFAASLPIYAALSRHNNPSRRKRYNSSFGLSMTFRVIIFSQLALIAILINVIFGMSLPMSSEFAVSAFLPIVLLTNIPVSAYIFRKLYQSKKYAVE